ncbi:MAG: ankyrin repeat domain-containing protein [Cyanobacteria bacterium]|nr:ankyrin repeat domain-containing protein [Cyanobacteriota bacterium]
MFQLQSLKPFGGKWQTHKSPKAMAPLKGEMDFGVLAQVPKDTFLPMRFRGQNESALAPSLALSLEKNPSHDLALESLGLNSYEKLLENKKGVDALYTAIQLGHPKALKWLLSQKVNPNAENPHLNSPLHLAARLGRVEMVKDLISAGANPSYVSDDMVFEGRSVLHEAVDAGSVEIAKVLIEKGLDPNRLEETASPVSMIGKALQGANYPMAMLLLDSGAKLEGKGFLGTTPFHGLGYLPIWKQQDFNDGTSMVVPFNPPDTPERREQLHQLVKLLKEKGFSLEAKNYRGYTPLQQAVLYNQPDVVEVFLAEGARVNGYNPKNGQRALDLADPETVPQMTELLKKHHAKKGSRFHPARLFYYVIAVVKFPGQFLRGY